MKFIEDAKLKMGVFLRERKERAEEKKLSSRRRVAEHGAPLLWIYFLIAIAVSTLIGSTWMLIVFIAGSVGHVDWAFDWRAGNDGTPGRWNWFAEADIHAIYGVGLFLFCLGIAAFNAVWLHIRHYLQGLFRNVATGIGIAVALFMVSGAIVTQQWGTDARSRDQVIATNTAQAGVAAINAEIAAIETEMGRLCAPNLTTYQAQACRSGEAAWVERIATAREQRDYQLPGIERALADARQGDRWRARQLELRQQAAVASVQTVQAEAATVTATGFMSTFARFLEEIRKPFIAVLGELLAMTMFGVALAAWRSRVPATDVLRSGWADEGHRIEDLRAQEPVVPKPMERQREVVTDAETGEELVRVRESKPRDYWRKVKKGKPTRVNVEPEIPADETGVNYDGGKRTAVTLGGEMELPAELEPTPAGDVRDDIKAAVEQPEASEHEAAGERESSAYADEAEAPTEQPVNDLVQPEPSDEEAALALQELELTATVAPEHLDEGNGENAEHPADEEHHETSDREEPETNPARMIAAE